VEDYGLQLIPITEVTSMKSFIDDDGVDFGTKNFQKSLYFKDLKQRGMQKTSRLPSRASNPTSGWALDA
jgi:hypothetical protein